MVFFICASPATNRLLPASLQLLASGVECQGTLQGVRHPGKIVHQSPIFRTARYGPVLTLRYKAPKYILRHIRIYTPALFMGPLLLKAAPIQIRHGYLQRLQSHDHPLRAGLIEIEILAGRPVVNELVQ